MLFELAACEPPPTVVMIEAPAPSVAEATLDTLLSPFQTLREQIAATTGIGLDDGEEVAEGLPRGQIEVPELGLQLSYISAGGLGGQRVILIHGSPGAAAEWAPLMRRGTPGQRHIAIDRPGFGETQPEAVEPSLIRQAAALRPLLEAEDGKAVLVGYSFGGPVALRAALDMPELVAGLLLVGSAANPAEEEVHPLQQLAALDIFAQILPRELDNANSELLALRGELEAMAPDLPRLAVPITLLHGLRDTLVPPENVLYLRRLVSPDTPLRIMLVEDGDHFLPWTHPQVVTSAIDCVIQDIRAQ